MRGPKPKLTPVQIAEIQSSTEKLSYLAGKYGVSQAMVSGIRTGVRHVSKEGEERILLARAIHAVNKLAVFYDQHKDAKWFIASVAFNRLANIRDKK